MDPADATENIPEDGIPTEEQGPNGADQFVLDNRTESVLTERGLNFKYVPIDIENIDLSALDKGEPVLQMRDEIIHLEVAQRYADDLRWGAKFPAGVLMKKSTKFVIVDFHHRLWAAREAGLTQVSAYVIPRLENEFDVIELGTRLNRDHGVQLTEKERIRLALLGLNSGRYRTARQASHVLGVKETAVGKAKRIEETRQIAQEVGVSLRAFDQLPSNSKERLSTLDSPEVFKSAFNSVLSQGLGTADVSALVKTINDSRGEAAQLTAIREFTPEVKGKPATGTGLQDPWSRLHASCRSILGLDLEDLDISMARRTSSELSERFAEAQEVIAKLTAIAEKLDAAEGMDEQTADVA